MKEFARRDAAIVLLWAAVTAVAFILRGDDFLPMALFVSGGPILGHLYSQRRTRRRYAARNQFECRVRLPAAASSRPRWARALATPYPEWVTLQFLSGGATAGDEPVMVRPADFAGTRGAFLPEFLFRFSPVWRVAAFHSDGEEVLVAAPASFLAVLSGPASRRAQHMP